MDNYVVFSDEKNHASIIDGLRHSGAEKRIFRHNDVAHLRELVTATDPTRSCSPRPCPGHRGRRAGRRAVPACLNAERERLWENATLIHRLLTERGIPFISDESHIVSVLIRDERKCKSASDLLLRDYGIYVQAINSPSVPAGEGILRHPHPRRAHVHRNPRRGLDHCGHPWGPRTRHQPGLTEAVGRAALLAFRVVQQLLGFIEIIPVRSRCPRATTTTTPNLTAAKPRAWSIHR